jgi:tripartite-type tricarboxylate transporter receptor subunit TctC
MQACRHRLAARTATPAQFGGMLAASTVARAANDGYTLLLTTNSTHSAANGLYQTVPYDPIKDFTPVVRIGGFPNFVAIHPDLPIRTPAEFVAYAKANPRKLNYGVGNSTGHIVGETVKRRTGIEMARVPYRSNPMAIPDLIAGRISVMFLEFTTGLPQLRAEKVRPIAMVPKERSPHLPGVPTLDETIMPGSTSCRGSESSARRACPPTSSRCWRVSWRRWWPSRTSRNSSARPAWTCTGSGTSSFPRS